MKPLNYCANTPQKIAALAACTPDDVQQYLQLCLEISATHTAHNVLAFPYDFSVNPYAVFYHWLEQAKFQIHPEFSTEEISQLRHLATLSVKEFRSQKVDSRQLFQSNPPSTNPFLLNFSQIYALHLALDSLHVYNFYLENYIHESRHLRAAIHNDQQRSESSPCNTGIAGLLVAVLPKVIITSMSAAFFYMKPSMMGSHLLCIKCIIATSIPSDITIQC